jgi:hypothetical protein
LARPLDPRAHGHLFGSVYTFPEFNEQSARRVGALLAVSKTAAIVDGNIAALPHPNTAFANS